MKIFLFLALAVILFSRAVEGLVQFVRGHYGEHSCEII